MEYPKTAEFNELLSTSDLAVVTADVVPKNIWPLINKMIEVNFEELNQRSAQRQDMTKEELYADLESDAVVKFLAFDGLAELAGFLTVHRQLDTVTWVDESHIDEMKTLQNRIDPNGNPMYVNTLVVPINMRGFKTASWLIRGSLKTFHDVNQAENNDSLCFFDCADANYPGLPHLIERAGLPVPGYTGYDLSVDKIAEDAIVEKDGQLVKVPISEAEKIGLTVLDHQHYFSIHMLP